MKIIIENKTKDQNKKQQESCTNTRVLCARKKLKKELFTHVLPYHTDQQHTSLDSNQLITHTGLYHQHGGTGSIFGAKCPTYHSIIIHIQLTLAPSSLAEALQHRVGRKASIRLGVRARPKHARQAEGSVRLLNAVRYDVHHIDCPVEEGKQNTAQ